ncbi:aminotransferase class I/II-fold pyridoxal phosphate-dependent enzyme [Deinococcus cellulosilyticus]|uniref:Aminotransferase n=1 Tax=Deinococcus cellulosilyticus (strain DSM 18568 / NBRC 106333 / KACC 11606 / 5516J-15) TaxID=1223518 RepID=A0A511N2S6_DEIC1|nr:aminotransferase class I/II-fold pyridoxal phosphate-dependent enzyme [Deinococcus cellulosilyticus]GEM46721.1 aminotransferase [Deinococcus cellulosilyticus NBRC 106333 = KACC 11606]
MKLNPFRIEEFYGVHEFTASHMLSSSDVESRSIQALLQLEPDALDAFLNLKLGYTEAPGAPELRQEIARQYTGLEADQVLVFSCAEEAIFVFYQALFGPEDHLMVVTPCYESGLELARSTGASVSVWERQMEDGWVYHVSALERQLQPNTRAIYLNTPNNPTGTQMDRETFQDLCALAEEKGIWLFSDEVYRGLEHDASSMLPAACEVTFKGVSVGSMSKSFGLPGLRLGWIACQDRDLLRKLQSFKFYTTICNSAPSEFLTTLALRHASEILQENRKLVLSNLALLQGFMQRHQDMFDWVPPQGSPIAFPRLKSGNASEFCRQVLEKTGILLLPGEVYDQPEHFRIGYGRKHFPEVLGLFEGFLKGH